MMIKDGYVKIRKGYLWCDDCGAFTPHEKIDNPFTWQEDHRTCMICDKTIEFDDQDCPKCGWRYIQYEDMSETNVKVHRHGCHYNDDKWNDDGDCFYGTNAYPEAERIWRKFIAQNFQFKDVKEIKCACPEYKIYQDPYCYASRGGYGHGFDCYNEQWWVLNIRCPICGERFEIEDGNC
jgi:hypothetical protein